MTTARRRELARALSGNTIHTAQSKGWDTLSNGALLNAAEEAGFDVLLTTDRRIRYQQNLRNYRIALVVLTGSTKWFRVREHADRIAAAVASTTPGSYSEIEIPLGAERGVAMSRVRGENSPEPPGSARRQIAHRTLRGGRVSRSNDKSQRWSGD